MQISSESVREAISEELEDLPHQEVSEKSLCLVLLLVRPPSQRYPGLKDLRGRRSGEWRG